MNMNYQPVIKLWEDTQRHHEHKISASHQAVRGHTHGHNECKSSASHQAMRGHTQKHHEHKPSASHQGMQGHTQRHHERKPVIKLCEDTHRHHEHKPCRHKYHLHTDVNCRLKHCMKIINYLWLADIVPLATLLSKWGDTVPVATWLIKYDDILRQ